MAKVSNLTIQLQQGTENTVYASWTFKDPTPPSTGGGSSSGGGGGGGSANIKGGSIVTVKQTATKWYNGATIASFVYTKQWKVLEAIGDRVVIHQSTDGAYAICSPIHRNNLNFIR